MAIAHTEGAAWASWATKEASDPELSHYPILSLALSLRSHSLFLVLPFLPLPFPFSLLISLFFSCIISGPGDFCGHPRGPPRRDWPGDCDWHSQRARRTVRVGAHLLRHQGAGFSEVCSEKWLIEGKEEC